MKHWLLIGVALLLLSAASNSAPTVNGRVISWSDDGWYQVQSADGATTFCNGGDTCKVEPGSYLVINHTTGERFSEITVQAPDGGGESDAITVTANVISWPEDGWYQVQNQATYAQVCAGTRSCTVEPGLYIVINHTTGQRFEGIKVSAAGTTPEPDSPIVVKDNLISWPDDGWYQVQSESNYAQVCAGTRFCAVEPGRYVVINHTSGRRYEGIVVDDPMIQSSTRVEFSITVPAYQSDALQVQIIWDTKAFNASWIGDELWAASDDFPTNTEHELVVTFSDANGSITLGQYESVFKTGTNDSEDVQVSAEQFNIDQWDSDEDGTSNIDELIAGTDPLVDEDSLLEIRDSAGVSLDFITHSFESRIPEERPYDEYHEELLVYHEGGRPPSGARHIIEIHIDERGNGTLSDSREEGLGLSPLLTSYTGTRTHSENSIKWDGKREVRRDWVDLYVTTTSDNTVSIIGERTRKYEETYLYHYDTSDESAYITERKIDLIGEVIEGTPFCQPVAGTVESETISPHDSHRTKFRTSMTKEIDDQYWRVKSTVTDNEPSDTEFLAREFHSTFQCNFVEF